MKKISKIIILLLVVAFIIGTISACGDNADTNSNANETNNTSRDTNNNDTNNTNNNNTTDAAPTNNNITTDKIDMDGTWETENILTKDNKMLFRFPENEIESVMGNELRLTSVELPEVFMDFKGNRFIILIPQMEITFRGNSFTSSIYYEISRSCATVLNTDYVCFTYCWYDYRHKPDWHSECEYYCEHTADEHKDMFIEQLDKLISVWERFGNFEIIEDERNDDGIIRSRLYRRTIEGTFSLDDKNNNIEFITSDGETFVEPFYFGEADDGDDFMNISVNRFTRVD